MHGVEQLILQGKIKLTDFNHMKYKDVKSFPELDKKMVAVVGH